MRNKQYLTAIRPLDGVLAMSTMRFADEVVPRGRSTRCRRAAPSPTPKALKMAAQIIDGLAADWKPAAVPRHLHRGAAQADQGEGRKGKEVVDETATAEPTAEVST